MQDRAEFLGKVDRGKNRPRARLRFAKTIRNKLRKNLINSRLSRTETGVAERENGTRV